MANGVRSGLWFAALIGVMLGAQGCREDEQDRVLFHDPGVYQGQLDETLSKQRVEELRQRARQQNY